MQVSVETTQGLERRLTITVPSEAVDSEVEKRLKKVARNRRIDGFRPGKAPLSLIKKHFGTSVTAEVVDELIQKNYVEAIIAEKIDAVGTPQFALTDEFGQGKDLTFTATIEVYPSVTVEGLEELQIEKKQASVQESDIDHMVETLRKQHGDWAESTEACSDGQRVTIDFKGMKDGVAFEGGESSDFVLVLGQGQMIPGFEDGILGKKAGDAFSIDVTFPEEYHAEALAGQPAVFEITLKKVEVLSLPELNAEFVKKFGIESGDVDDLRKEIAKNMERELKQALRNQLKEQVLDKLAERNAIDVPKAAVETQIKQLRESARERFDLPKDHELPAELFEDKALRQVRLSLLLGQIVHDNKIEASDEKVKELITSMASAYEDPQEVIDHYQNDARLLKQVQDLSIEEQAIDQILEKAQVTLVDTVFSDVVNTQESQ